MELLVDSKSFNDDVLYKPVGSTGNFVSCQLCNAEVTPDWFKSGVKISPCGSGSGPLQEICADNKNNKSDLQFSFFLQSHIGSYTCSKHGSHKSLTIEVLYPPIITIHPTNVLTANDTSGTLNCEGTGKGLIKYQWEASNVNGGPWTQISNDNNRRLIVRGFWQSQQYRCIVSNEAGAVRSSIATVTTLSKHLCLI